MEARGVLHELWVLVSTTTRARGAGPDVLSRTNHTINIPTLPTLVVLKRFPIRLVISPMIR